ncbi:unnamed protein product [[Actinomadura] parvosata subsp. kistnae]|uniref:Uncharacterized protein n=1 Tax=[Actinomadura] parvosata subsp. kistnae TaxID=1909395 RepID=A0A1U9ZX35_9ACTN|nr:hypothetical protein [Nonomuraea sp. ATCC 55076]AQZ62500.1 hypothetical protein BKM31_14445 [Nonomuraea sp. ATCC 55076]SPL88749.1 unnamed protein product [Actinomadura parvosata subsp. kistnae]
MRDRDAEVIWTVLRKAGRRELSERYDGFVVEGGSDGAPFPAACTEEAEGSALELTRYRVDLVKAGWGWPGKATTDKPSTSYADVTHDVAGSHPARRMSSWADTIGYRSM